MKKIISLLIIFTIFSTNSWEVFSEQKFHSSERKEILQEQKIEIPSEKKEFFQEQKKEKNIFQNVPESKQKIVNNFLEKYNKKWYFSQLEKISYRKKSTNRWLASWTKIYFDFEKIDTNEEFKRVMTHEMWHVFDLWYLKSKEKKIVSNFKDWTNKIYADDPSVEFYSLCFETEKKQNWKCETKDFASKYWQTDPFEDFAESFLLFIENNNSFREMANESKIMQKKYTFIKKYFWKIDSPKYPWQKSWKRVWDLTLAY